MKNNEFIDLCVSKLVEYVNSNLDKSDDLINITDKTILTKNNNLVRKIINLEGGN